MSHDCVCPWSQPCMSVPHSPGDYCATCGDCTCAPALAARQDERREILSAVRSVLSSHPGADDPEMCKAVYDAIEARRVGVVTEPGPERHDPACPKAKHEEEHPDPKNQCGATCDRAWQCACELIGAAQAIERVRIVELARWVIVDNLYCGSDCWDDDERENMCARPVLEAIDRLKEDRR